MKHNNFLPSLSSPKFPHPIFFPTRKLGPTIRTPAELDTLCRLECIPLLLAKLGLLLALTSLVSLSLLFSRVSRFCIMWKLVNKTNPISTPNGCFLEWQDPGPNYSQSYRPFFTKFDRWISQQLHWTTNLTVTHHVTLTIKGTTP